MKAAEAVIQGLREEKVKVVFGYPGAAVLPIYEALRNSDIDHILVRHEQAAGHSASGYARATGTTGVCIVTSGPGATNVITAIATAYMDSIPLIIITGQVKSTLIGKDVFQEADIIGATESFTKHNYLVKDAKDIPRILKEAFYIAGTGRPGPVLIDIPMDILDEEIEFEYPESANIRGYKPTVHGHQGQIRKALERIKTSKKPLICVGGGVVSAKAEKELREFVEKSQIPIVHTLMGKDSINVDNPYYVGLLGTHGFSYANKAVAEADVLILIGTRVADRATAGLKYFAKNADIIHIDIDPAEIGKNLGPTIPVVGDSKNVLRELIKGIVSIDTQEWIKDIKQWKDQFQVVRKDTDKVNPKEALRLVSELVEDDAILVADVGQNQIWSARNFDVKGTRKFFTSGGLGTMGYSLPAAVGAKMGCQNKRVVSVMGDGAFQMSLFELGTIAENNLNIIILLFNNSGLGMVREIQTGKGKNYYGVDFKANPDFIKLAEAYGLPGRRVNRTEEFQEALKEAMKSNKAFFIECIVDPYESTF
ncbi:biosynthetic-type acetolactate synthase large subunit [Clostridium sp. DJ247]|uniref:biosynthetic-type acetolactate synthase large subunit n=1 Tax=Clostridium sp. DJ247 TaxID=2726188 RepID=UPI0016248185|nr:biosynthetic-type acetolactate synthase large subunit [Clostridium sp. DJ247]MBC2580495.1 biosynthetic-type acetolactate synthase large subunit [Clostridium sp. DJ247]